jgi:putative flippase GtrA
MKIIRYFCIGAAAAALDVSLFLALTMLWGLRWFSSALISFFAATLLNYFLSVRHVFESGIRFRRRHEILLVFAVSGAGLLVNQGVLWMLIDVFNVGLAVSKLCATAAVFFWNFGARHRFIFREQ